MGRQPKEFKEFATLTDRLLSVPRETLEKRLQEHRDAPRTGAKPGPKPRQKPATA
ncbi:MAG: hypothetical protein R2708_25905 [Vicinamibacterales bacterium]